MGIRYVMLSGPSVTAPTLCMYIYTWYRPATNRGGSCVCWIVGSRFLVSRRQAAESCASPLDGRVIATIV